MLYSKPFVRNLWRIRTMNTMNQLQKIE